MNSIKNSLEPASLQKVACDFLQHFADSLENDFPDVESDYSPGMLNITCLSGQIFIVHWHAPSQQLWLASPFSGAWTFSYAPQTKRWYCFKKQQDLQDLINSELSSRVQ